MNQGKFRQAVKQSINGAPPVLKLGPACEGNLIWSSVDQAVTHLQGAVLRALEEHCPLARPSRFARRAWSRECSILVRAHRAARQCYTSGHGLEDEVQYKDLRNQLK